MCLNCAARHIFSDGNYLYAYNFTNLKRKIITFYAYSINICEIFYHLRFYG